MTPQETSASIHRATKIWLFLVLATVLAAGLSFLTIDGRLMTLITVMILIWKGQMIVDDFMGLKTSSTFWRVVMSAYCVVIGVVVFAVYCIR